MTISGNRRRHRRAARTFPPGGRLRVAAEGLGVLAPTAAWVVLVRLAIGFADEGTRQEAAWWPLLGTTLAAVACLIVALAFGRRLLVSLGVASTYQPKRARGR